jgi:transposase
MEMRKPYPNDVSDEEWAFVAPYLMLPSNSMACGRSLMPCAGSCAPVLPGEEAAQAAKSHGITLEVLKHQEAKRGFVLLPRRWVVERSFAWKTKFRRLAKDYERLPETVRGLHFGAFTRLMVHQLVSLLFPGS